MRNTCAVLRLPRKIMNRSESCSSLMQKAAEFATFCAVHALALESASKHVVYSTQITATQNWLHHMKNTQATAFCVVPSPPM